jgi:GTP1/Obg family GTP-binding protein
MNKREQNKLLAKITKLTEYFYHLLSKKDMDKLEELIEAELEIEKECNQ